MTSPTRKKLCSRRLHPKLCCCQVIQETVPGFPALVVLNVGDGLTTARLTTPTQPCPTCYQPTYPRAEAALEMNDLPRGWAPAKLRVLYRPVECRKRCKQPHPLVVAGIRADAVVGSAKRVILTQRLYDALIERYLRGETIPALAVWSGLDPTRLGRYLIWALDANIAEPRDTTHWEQLTHVGIDELFWRGEALGVIVDLVSGQLLEVLPDREPDTLTSYLREIKAIIEGKTGRPWQPVIVTDMWLAFRTVIRTVFGPEARLVVDRFHLVAKVSEDLQEAVQALLVASRERPEQLRKIRAAYLHAFKTGVVKSPVLGDAALENKLAAFLRVGCSFHTIWSAPTLPEAEQAFFDWLGQQNDLGEVNGHLPFGRLAYLLAEWKNEVLAFHHPDALLPGGVKPTNGKTESVNGRLRQFERRSQAARRLPWGGEDDEKAQVQRQFGRFAARARYSLNTRRTKAAVLESSLWPQPTPCVCGAPVGDWIVQPLTQRAVWDLPLGDHRVRASCSNLTARCSSCQRTQVFAVPTQAGMTERLGKALAGQVAQGRLLGRLQRDAGPSVDTLRQAPGLLEPLIRPAGAWIGVLRWRWRKQQYWLITEIDTGRPLELLPVGPSGRVQAYLASPAAQAIKYAVLNNPAWLANLPEHIQGVIDTFSAIRLVQPALREVQRRFTDTLPVPTRRTDLFRGHRALIHRNPDTVVPIIRRRSESDPAVRRDVILQRHHRLQLAYRLVQDFRAPLQSQPTDHEVALTRWTKQVSQQTATPPKTGDDQPDLPIERSFYYGFQTASHAVERYKREIALGRTHRAFSLARSRRTLRSFKALEAASGYDFSTLRRAVLNFVPNVSPNSGRAPVRRVSEPAVPVRHGLTEDQQAAVISPHTAGLTTVTAVAGAGKTRMLIDRAAYLIEQGFRPRTILFLTFTGAAASELRERLRANPVTASCQTHTLHGFCRDLLIQSEMDIRQAQAAILHELDPTTYGFDSSEKLKRAVSQAKQTLYTLGLDDAGLILPRQPLPHVSAEAEKALRAYENVRRQLSRKANRLYADHDDVLLLTLYKLISHDPAVEYRIGRVKAVIVDEYQDVSPLQAALLQRIASDKNFMVVGDPAQSIFGFQNSSPDLLQALVDQPDSRNYVLSDNFRSPGAHLLAASALLEDNFLLVPAKGYNGTFAIECCQDAAKGLEALARQLRRWAGEPVTVLVRSNAEVDRVKRLLMHHAPGDQARTQPLDERLVRRWNDPGCQRVLRPLLQALEWHWATVHPLQDTFTHLKMDLDNSDRRWLNQLWMSKRVPGDVAIQTGDRPVAVQEALTLWDDLLKMAGIPMDQLLIQLAPHLSGLPDTDLKEARELLRQQLPRRRLIELLTPLNKESSERCQVMTIHKAKGREFPNVIVFAFPRDNRRAQTADDEFDDDWGPDLERLHKGADLWVIPTASEKPTRTPQEEEEHRIGYVALTRATRQLCLITSSDSLYGRVLTPSKQQEIAAVHALMSRSAVEWTLAQIEAFPALTRQSSVRGYLERYWWKEADAETLRQAATLLIRDGQPVPPLWAAAFDGKTTLTPRTVKVQRQLLQ